MLNADRSVALHMAAYISLASDTFGAEGSAALRRLLDAVKRILARFPPDALTAGITIVAPLSSGDGPHGAGGARRADDDAALATLLSRVAGRPVVMITADDAYELRTAAPGETASALSTAAIVYSHDGTFEELHAGGTSRPIPRLIAGTASAFADPTFVELDDALRFYEGVAQDCRCDTLADAWAGGVDGPRLVFVAKPEAYMRDSLARALDYLLRHADVTREHSTDAARPVDIRVRWQVAPVEALIEVKWIGQSLTDGSTELLSYRDARANAGARQLADYLERQRANSNAVALRGYLVVFDGRRAKVRNASDPLTKGQATHFADREIVYTPDRTKTVRGFERPVRLFLRPRETHFADAA